MPFSWLVQKETRHSLVKKAKGRRLSPLRLVAKKEKMKENENAIVFLMTGTK
jgi:hypothetical protein